MEKIEFLDPRFAGRGEEFRVGALREREEELAALDRLDSNGEDFRCRLPLLAASAACCCLPAASAPPAAELQPSVCVPATCLQMNRPPLAAALLPAP
jgi:hypothetical protein